MAAYVHTSNWIMAINPLAESFVTYIFNIINWTIGEIKKINSKERILMACNKMHHPETDVVRFYIARSNGVLGLIQL